METFKIHVSGKNSKDAWVYFDANARIFITTSHSIIYL